MSEIILLKESNCKDCYKCIRHCPVKAISFAENRAEIIPDECILCGQCYVVCPQNAKQIRSDVDKVKAAIRGQAGGCLRRAVLHCRFPDGRH